MSLDNPYRAAGAFRGKAYIRREADAQLIEQIEDNQYYPYFAAPRQSGKSSLLMRTMAALAPVKYRAALVDLSPFVVSSYDDFWRQFLYEVARSANFDPTPIASEDPRDVFLTWLRGCKQRIVVFMDEIDVLLGVDCREQIFSKFRTFYNMRARPDTPELERLQFVLAGAAHSSRFIKDPRWSPFNVAIEIELEDLTPAQVSQLSAYLATAGAFAGPDLTQRVHELSGGSVFLCQLMFEQLWNTAARGNPRLGAADVDAVVETIVAESPRNIHFYNIFRLVTADPRLAMLFRRLTDGQELGEEEQKELRLTGLCRGANPFRNEIYARVFGPGGPLDLKVGSKQIELGKQLDAALARRERLRGEPSDAAAADAAETEVRRLRREFREGTALQVGDVLGRGRYRVDEKIGQGGFATVWRAYDGKLQHDVAIKVLHGQFAEDRSRRDRFFRGAWRMSELRHPGVVEVIEPYGEENGYYYFVMEYLRDGTLHSAVLEKKLDVAGILKIVARIGQALGHAHARGLVHRDVKPTNVLVSGDAGKLTDFDLVRDSDGAGGTKTGAMGTFLYASPEVMSQPQQADARADIYGLGMTAVFALHGDELAMDVIRDTDRFIDRLPGPAAVHAVLKKAVAWQRDERYASSAEFVAALERAGRSEPAASHSARIAEWGGSSGDSVLLGLATVLAPAPQMRAPAPAAARRAAEAPAVMSMSHDDEAGALAQLESEDEDAAGPAQPQGPSVSSDMLESAPILASAASVSAERGAVSSDMPERSRPTSSVVSAVPADMSARAPEPAAASIVAVREVPRAAAGAADSSEAVPRANTGAQVRGAPQEPREPRRRWPVYAMGLAASLALLLVALDGLGLPVSTVQVPGERRSEGESAQKGVVAEFKRAEPAPGERDDAGAGSGVVAAPSGPGEVALASAAETIVGEAEGAAETTAETTGPAPSADEDSGARPPADTTSTPPPMRTSAGDTSGVEVKPPIKVATPSFDELTQEGCNQVQFGDANKALPLLRQAHDIKPHNLRMLECLARANLGVNRYEAAETYFLQILKEEPRSRKALLGVAEANEKMSRLGNAAMYYELLLQREPNNFTAQQFFRANPSHDTRRIVRTAP